MLQIYFLRHGQTASSRENLFCGSGTDIPLTEPGQVMAREFAEFYKDTAWKAIYHSPLERTRVTAEIITTNSGIQLQQRDNLTEIGYGAWEGKSVEEVDRTYHDEHVSWIADPAWYPPTDGESAIAVSRRALSVIQEIRDAFQDGKVLIVSHKATIRIALCALIGIDVGRFRYRLACPVGSVSIVQFGAHGPLIEQIGDRSHLSEQLKNLPGT
ncbi:MAG: histidine phosphatase family protein [Bacteroidota bacterium]|nr:histidine phosphatase family protein [Bacteroidota bacterium]MDP4233168.1 histidine phosphatase family protein [Bacteroidota bacterium]MDP4241687.1 histidine phosphatase family protein [Bacteroidota bacterium]MDP4287345.1 histidine phosphatase family protein [Bacteroidota bacterium]